LITAQLKEYRENGFYIAKGLLDEASVSAVRQSIAKTFLDQLAVVSPPSVNLDLFEAMKDLHSLDIDRYKKTAGALWRKLDCYELLHDCRITAFLRHNFGWRDIFVPGGQVAHIMSHELRIPDGYFGQVSHQDFLSVRGSLDCVIVWVPLVDVGKDNFPVEVIPGSHRKGLLPTLGRGSSAWEVKPDCYSEREFIGIEVQAGDVVFLSVFTIHRTSTHGKQGRYRLALSTRFDNADERTFLARAYPTAYIRSMSNEPHDMRFPTLEEIDTIFSNLEREACAPCSSAQQE